MSALELCTLEMKDPKFKEERDIFVCGGENYFNECVFCETVSGGGLHSVIKEVTEKMN